MVFSALVSCLQVCAGIAAFTLEGCCPIGGGNTLSRSGVGSPPVPFRYTLPPAPSHILSGEGKELKEEPYWKDLVGWVGKRGSVSENVVAGTLAGDWGSAEKRGLYALRDICAGEALAVIPRECCIDGTNGIPEQMQAILGRELFSLETCSAEKSWVSTAIRILMEEQKGENSTFAPLLRTLPSQKELQFHPQMWDPDWFIKNDPYTLGGEGKAKKSPMIQSVTKQRRMVLFMYPKVRRAFKRVCSIYIPSLNDWIRAAVLAMSHAIDQKLDPVADLVNHHPYNNEYLDQNKTCNVVRVVSPDTEDVHLIAFQDIKKGDEILMDYFLNHTILSYENLCKYGFIPADTTISPDPADWGLNISYADLWSNMGGPRLFDWTFTWVMPPEAKYGMKKVLDELVQGHDKIDPLRRKVCDVKQIWRLSQILKLETRGSPARALVQVFLSVRVAMLAVAFKNLNEDLHFFLQRSLHEYLQTLAYKDSDELAGFDPTFDPAADSQPAGVEVMKWLWPSLVRAHRAWNVPKLRKRKFEDDPGIKAAVEKYGGGEMWTVLRNRNAPTLNETSQSKDADLSVRDRSHFEQLCRLVGLK